MTRYAHQNGFYVDRRFGWDCHGLPVEYEIDKAIGIKSPEDVMKMGIAAYNAECKKIVMRYSSEWEVRTDWRGGGGGEGVGTGRYCLGGWAWSDVCIITNEVLRIAKMC